MKKKVHEQVKDSSSSIERILRPLTYTSWLLSVGVAHPQKCPKAITIIIHIVHMAVCSYIMIRETQYIFTFLSSVNQINILSYIYILNRMMHYISSFYYIYYGIVQYNKWPELMDRLKELDQKIRKEISMNDRSVGALAVFVTFTFCPLWPTSQLLYYYIFSYIINEKVIVIELFFYILAQSLINSFVFDFVVYVLYRRFHTINKLIGQLDKLSDVQCIAFKIRRIRELHADICDLASMVNDIHGLHLLFCCGSCFTMSTASLLNLCHAMYYIHRLTLIHYLLCIVYFMQFCLICWICTLACEESNKTGRNIHKIILNCKSVGHDKHEASNQSNLEVHSSLEDSNREQNFNCSSSRHDSYVVESFLRRNLDLECVTKEVKDFSIQLQQNRIAFTACDFFEINNSSYGMFLGVITYLLIMLLLYPLHYVGKH